MTSKGILIGRTRLVWYQQPVVCYTLKKCDNFKLENRMVQWIPLLKRIDFLSILKINKNEFFDFIHHLRALVLLIKTKNTLQSSEHSSAFMIVFFYSWLKWSETDLKTRRSARWSEPVRFDDVVSLKFQRILQTIRCSLQRILFYWFLFQHSHILMNLVWIRANVLNVNSTTEHDARIQNDNKCRHAERSYLNAEFASQVSKQTKSKSIASTRLTIPQRYRSVN